MKSLKELILILGFGVLLIGPFISWYAAKHLKGRTYEPASLRAETIDNRIKASYGMAETDSAHNDWLATQASNEGRLSWDSTTGSLFKNDWDESKLKLPHQVILLRTEVVTNQIPFTEVDRMAIMVQPFLRTENIPDFKLAVQTNYVLGHMSSTGAVEIIILTK